MAAIGVLAATSAKADADLVCSRSSSIALVRFDPDYEGSGPAYTKLPKRIDGGLSSVAPGRRSDCKLPDGRAIRIREGWKQAFAYGQGGADPPAFFSLWIDGRKVLSRRQWKPGYGDAGPRLVAVVVKNEELLFCTEAHDNVPIRCRAEGINLAQSPIDEIEYPQAKAARPIVGSVFVVRTSHNGHLCREYLNSVRKDFDQLVGGAQDTTAFSAHWKPPMTGPGPTQTVVQAALAQGGRPYKIALFTGNNHYFDGDISAIAPASTPSSQILSLAPTIEKAALAPWPSGWGFVSGGRRNIFPTASDRYVHLNPVRLNGRLYFFAYPTKSDDRVAAMLIGIEPDLKPIAVCEFDRVLPHF